MSANHLSVLVHQLRTLVADPRKGDSDDALLAAFVQRSDEQAFAILMRRYGKMVFSASRRWAGNEQDAEDVFQATFLLLARKAATIRRRGAVGSWLFRVANRLAARLKSATANRRLHEQNTACPVEVEQFDDLTLRELRVVLDQELARLPDKYRAPLLLCYFEGLTQEEAAQRLGWSKRSVKDRLERGRDRLRSRLTRRGLALSAAMSGSMLLPGGYAAAVPAVLAHDTLRAAKLFAVRQSVVGTASVQAIALAKGGLKAMLIGKLLAATIGVMVLVGVGSAGLFVSQGVAESDPEATTILPVPPAPRQIKTPQPQKVVVDRFGDALPQGAIARLGTVRYRNGGGVVRGLGFQADNRTLVSTGEHGGVIQFWDSATGKLLRDTAWKDFFYYAFAISSDGKCLAVAGLKPNDGYSGPGSIRIVDATSGKEVRTFERSDWEAMQSTMALTSDGKHLASLSNDGPTGSGNTILRIEETATGKELQRCNLNRDNSGSVVFSPDGAVLAIRGGESHKLYVWKWQSEVAPREFKGPEKPGCYAVCFSPDSKLLAEACWGSFVRIWDVADEQILRKLTAPQPEDIVFGAVAWSPDSKTLAYTGYDRHRPGVVHLWDTVSWKYRMCIDAKEVLGLAFSPDSSLLAGKNHDMVHVWDVASGKRLAADHESHQGNIQAFAATNDLIVTGDRDNSLRIWDSATGKHLHHVEIPADDRLLETIAISPDATKFVATSSNGAGFWDLARRSEIHRLPVQQADLAVAFTPNGKQLLASGSDMHIRQWDVATGKLVSEHLLRPTGVPESRMDELVRHPEYTSRDWFGSCPFSSDGRFFMMHIDNQLHVFDTATAKDLYQITLEHSGILSFTMSPDNRLLLTSGQFKPLKIPLPGVGIRIKYAAAHPVSLWELSSRKERMAVNLPGNIGGPTAFSPDGKFFAVTTRAPAATVWIWETATGKHIGTIQGYRGDVQRMAFTPDGQRLITAMTDTTALVWDLNAVKK